MDKEISKTQIDRLGERLKRGKIEDADLRLLDQYRRSYAEAYDAVIGAISRDLSLAPTGRPAKSTPSIVEKLRRESIRLTQIQDIAGCRIVVADIASQNAVVHSLQSLFENVAIVDRRAQPSHGYRAIHVIVHSREKLVEIQVRTVLQHLWAELSEKCSDVFDQSIKYGGGSKEDRVLLEVTYPIIVGIECEETALAELSADLTSLESAKVRGPQTSDYETRVCSLRQNMIGALQDGICRIDEMKGKDDISN